MVKNAHGAGAYVIVHGGVDKYQRGQVVRADAFKVVDDKGAEVYDGLDRLIGLGALRPATDVEAAGGKGFVSALPGLSTAAQMRLATLDAEVDGLRRLLGAQQERLDGFAGLGVKPKGAETPAAEDPTLSAVYEERRAEIEALRKQAADNDVRLKELAGQAAQAGQEARAAADPELSGSAPLTGEEGAGGARRHRRHAES